MPKKRKAKKTKLKTTKAKKTKVKRKRNKPERHPNQDVGTPEPTMAVPTAFGPNSAATLEIDHVPELNDAPRRALFCMDPKLIMDHLAQAEVHVAQGANHVKRQRQLVEDLARDGHDTTGSSALLDLFKELQDLHVQDRDRLRAELASLRRRH
jgi:hypothetical protein